MVVVPPVPVTAAVFATGITAPAGGTTTIYAIPTKVGAGVITVTSGGLTATYTLTGTLSAPAKAQLVTLTAGTNAKGKAAYTVTTTDIFGNVVAADVNISMSGAGYLSNGFKNMTLTTLAADGSNTFDVISDGSAASGITATVPSNAGANFTAVSAAEAATSGIAASVATVTATVTVTGKSDDTIAAEAAYDAALEAIDAATAAEEAAFEAIAAADAATLAAEEAKASADAATTAIEELSSQVATLMAALQAQITTLANTVAKILKRLPKK